MEAEPITVLPPRDPGRAMFRQTWADLTFLHWAVDPDLVAPHLPPGIRPDVHGGVSHVGLVPFSMRDVAISPGPAVPYFGTFAETNVRLYSVDSQGRRGVVFCTLDADRLVPVLVARAFRVPYVWSKMSVRREGDLITYRAKRRPPFGKRASSLVQARIGPPIEGNELEQHLTARWGLHRPGLRGSRYWPNSHGQWPLHSATLERIDDGLLAAAGFPGVTDRPPDSVLFSPGVETVFGPALPA
jgi:uncharacterized protein YqjF (DUF2071 family)